jgi:serine/threonine-protein kinase
MRVLIAVVAGPHQGQVFAFNGHDMFLVGRSKNAHFRLPKEDEYFSRLHFMVEVNPPCCRLMDMGSTNGTYVNGQRVALADLKDGDLIQGGQTVLRVSIEDTDSEVVTRALPGSPAVVAPPVAAPPAGVEEPGEQDFPEPAQAVPAGTPLAETLPPFALGPLTATCAVCTQPAPEAVPGELALCLTCHEGIGRLPQNFPGFWLVRVLGKGGMGMVYLAWRLADRAVVALKTIRPAVEAGRPVVERFLREARILEELDHPYIVAFRSSGQSGGLLYFVMDYVPGDDAATLLARDGPWPIPRAVARVCQLLEALQYAHDRGFVHRDIKPANLLITEEAGQEVVKVVDFGLARTYQASKLSGLTMAGATGGTVPFMAPEQITSFREARPPVDQYAAAATLYNLLTGQFIHDFPAANHLRLLRILQEDPVPLRMRRPEVPEALATIIHRALAREPERRFAGVEQFRQALVPFRDGAGSGEVTPALSSLISPSAR